MFGPPTVGCACYYVFTKGKQRVLRALKDPTSVESSASAHMASVCTLVVAYSVLLRTVVPAFDEGGSLSLDWKKGTESLGEPLKIQTWRHFYRAAGPPVFARTAALIASFYVAGYVHGRVSCRQAARRR